jgi:glycosyltransferase involved in cell wall biosynthesis
VTRSDLGRALALNRRPAKQDLKYFQNFDTVISMNNYASRALESLKDAGVVRYVHSSASDRAVSTYVSMKFSPTEYLRMFIQRGSEIANERRLTGKRTLCVSRYLSNVMEMHRVEASSNLFFVPNGIDFGTFCPQEKEKLRDLVFVGRFQKMKGLDVLIGALNSLSRKGKRFTIGIAGHFNERQRRYCLGLATPDVRARVNFLGIVVHERMPEIYNSAVATVCPSRYESFCMPALESLACGRPVVASDIGGIPELVDSSVGSLVKPGNAESLSQAILEVLENQKLQADARTKGPEKVESYGWDVVSKSLLDNLTHK